MVRLVLCVLIQWVYLVFWGNLTVSNSGLSRRDFNILLGVTLAQWLTPMLPAAAEIDDDDFLLRHYANYEKKYPITDPLFSLPNKTFQFDGKTVLLNTERFCFVNYDSHSQRKRFFIFNHDSTTELSSLVSHGITTGNNTAHLFSNTKDSNQSSLGIYVTGSHYLGDFGPAINLHGICDTNNKAYSRRIVMHGANYCGPEHVKKYGFLGRSLGCIALPKKNMITAYQVLEPGTLVITKMDISKKMTEPLVPPTIEERMENRIP